MMVAYNFQKRFAEPIKTGAKSHTIRKNGKRRHARPGESLQLYTGMRTSSCKKILEPDPVCVFCKSIRIDVGAAVINSIALDGFCIHSLELHAFAIADGFKSLADMHAFWIDFHGPGVFEGSMIGWEPSHDRCFRCQQSNTPSLSHDGDQCGSLLAAPTRAFRVALAAVTTPRCTSHSMALKVLPGVRSSSHRTNTAATRRNSNSLNCSGKRRWPQSKPATRTTFTLDDAEADDIAAAIVTRHPTNKSCSSRATKTCISCSRPAASISCWLLDQQWSVD